MWALTLDLVFGLCCGGYSHLLMLLDSCRGVEERQARHPGPWINITSFGFSSKSIHSCSRGSSSTGCCRQLRKTGEISFFKLHYLFAQWQKKAIATCKNSSCFICCTFSTKFFYSSFSSMDLEVVGRSKQDMCTPSSTIFCMYGFIHFLWRNEIMRCSRNLK